jgi:hypothetical protein
MSRPGDWNVWQGIGTVEITQLLRVGGSAFLLRIDDSTTEAPLKIVIWPPEGKSITVQQNDRVWVKGHVRCDPDLGRRAMHYVQAQFIDVLARRQKAS